MIKTKKVAWVVVGTLAAATALCGGTVSVPAHAEVVAAVPLGGPRTTLPCQFGAPDATVTWGANELDVGASSPNASYGRSGCPAYVVDFDVSAATATVPSPNWDWMSTFSLGGDDPARTTSGGLVSISRANCSSYVQRVQVYKKAAGQSAFTYVGGGFSRGAWHTGFMAGCGLVEESGFTPYGSFTPPASGTDTYRVAIGVTIGSSQGRARAFGDHLPAPPR